MTTDEPLCEGEARLGLVDSLDLYSWRALPFFSVGAAFFIWLAVGDWLPFRGPFTNVLLFGLSGVTLLFASAGTFVLVRSFIAIRRAGAMNVALKILSERIAWRSTDGTWRESSFETIIDWKEDRRGLFLRVPDDGAASPTTIFVPRACFPESWTAVHRLVTEGVQRGPTI